MKVVYTKILSRVISPLEPQLKTTMYSVECYEVYIMYVLTYIWEYRSVMISVVVSV